MLLLQRQPIYNSSQDGTHGGRVGLDEGGEVDVGEESIEELTVHPIGNPSVPRYRVGKVFELEGSFEATSKEPTERGDSGCKDGQDDSVPLDRIEGNLANTNANLQQSSVGILEMFLTKCRKRADRAADSLNDFATKMAFGVQEVVRVKGEAHTFCSHVHIANSKRINLIYRNRTMHIGILCKKPSKLHNKKDKCSLITSNLQVHTTKPKIKVVIKAPKNPSQVFFGDSLISGVRPSEHPNT